MTFASAPRVVDLVTGSVPVEHPHKTLTYAVAYIQ